MEEIRTICPRRSMTWGSDARTVRQAPRRLDVDHFLPQGVLIYARGRGRGRDAGVGDRHVDATEALDGRTCRGVEGCGIGHVAGETECAVTD